MVKIILGILVLGGVAFFIFSGNGKDDLNNTSNKEQISEQSQNEQVSEAQSEDFEEKTTLAKLMEKTGNYMCTFTHNTQMGESTGTVHISGKRIRGDFISKVSVPGLPNMSDIKTYMISDGESVYTWSSMSSEGYKVPVSDQDKTSQSEDTSIPTNQELDYRCISWKVDASKFSLPTNITFKTL
jgi:hypothetical protein